MRLPRNYGEATARLGIVRCVGSRGDVEWDHATGIVDEYGVIHWQDRLLRRRDLWRFLLLVGWAQHMTEFAESMPRWKRLYLQSIYGYEAGRTLGLVFTRKEMLLRKMRTSNALRGVLIAVDDRPLARKAADWARRR
jgi:hypothetical protein